jgi:hypothetical protein
MTAIAITSLIISTINTFSSSALTIVTAVIAVGLAFLLFRWGKNLVWHADGTTNWLGRHSTTWDKLTYKPYKGYNRFRSRSWNIKNTM